MVLHGVPPDRTLLQVLREDLCHTGTKEGCGEGDCGACTVVLGDARGDGKLHYSAINSCIRLAHSIDGMALWTVEDLAEDPLIQPMDLAIDNAPKALCTPTTPPVGAAGLHPAQEAMVQCHGSQCGFCTPGFVMSLFGMYQNHVVPTLSCAQAGNPAAEDVDPALAAAVAALPTEDAFTVATTGQPITRALAQEELSGNLCRCTGYRPIFDAAQQMSGFAPLAVNEPELLQKLELLALTAQALEANFSYISPTTLPDLLVARATHPGAQIVAGCTDVGLWVTKQFKQFDQIIDVTRAAEMLHIGHHPDHIALGAAVTLTDAFAALTAQWPQLHRFATRFAGLPVRNSGTLGGNVANGSPIGDSMPLLIALRAQVVLASAARGERTLALEDLYTGYRKNVMAPDELLVRVLVPRPGVTEALRAYKISKRFDDDISAVCLVINLDIEGDQVRRASIGVGGVAATPVRAHQTEAALVGQVWSADTVLRAQAALQAEFNPISDMRASGAYRRSVLASLLQRFWLETQGQDAVSIDNLNVEAL